MGKHNLSISFA